MSAVVNMWGLPGGASVYSNLYSYSWDINDDIFGRYSSHVPTKHFQITRKPDKNSNILLQLCCSGDTIDIIKVTMTYTDEDGYAAKGSLIFRDSGISSLTRTGNGGSVEKLSVGYTSYSHEY